ncbi:cellulose synthase-like protein H1 isoform X2 [Panicum miliaceum]|uniref:Cellulose synthase-like protein H1 isoform X2 n=1 Tax=Panicum miliaceum TaxID=4540 RepID=A0A3L6RP36_PANMI|nr:cellulose synthase-like protein H1 isoform X2 [Panicum miliaceum]
MTRSTVDKALQDDPFGNQAEVKYKKLGCGFAGLQGIYYNGTICFHRRKVIYGMPPNCTTLVKPRRTKGSRSPSWEELQVKLGNLKELVESARSIISGDMLAVPIVDLSSRIEVAKEVSACSYEARTSWGREIGWVYGSMSEDILTGQRIHAAGWKSAALNTNPPAFLGSAPTGGPTSLTQYKRWATGLFEILMSRNNPILLSICKRLQFRQCLAYLVLDVWPLRAPFELCYSLLGPYRLLANHSFLPKLAPGGTTKGCSGSSHPPPGSSHSSPCYLKTVGLSETVFEVTRKDKSSCDGNGSTDEADKGRFTFDSSPVFIPPAALAILKIVAIAVGAWRVVAGAVEDKRGGPGVGEFVCCSWLVLCFWPFVTGLVGRGSYGIPWSVKLKAGLLVAAFVNFCR